MLNFIEKVMELCSISEDLSDVPIEKIKKIDLGSSIERLKNDILNKKDLS